MSLWRWLALLPALGLLSCAPSAVSPERPEPLALSRPREEPRETTIHVVEKGETVYRIARDYGILPKDLMQENGIQDPRTLEVGQRLKIPRAKERDGAYEPPIPEEALRQKAEEPPPPPAPKETPPGTPEERPLEKRAEERHLTPAQAPLVWPLKGVLYGRFGIRGGARHDGIDIAAPEGSPVVAAAEGATIYVGPQSGYGLVVILKHAGGLVTVYAHNSAVLVKEGDHVAQGQLLARVGQTGRTTGPHLHFEVREGTRPKNPLLYLP